MRPFIFLLVVAICAPAEAEEFKVACWNIKFFFDHDTDDNQSQVAVEMAAPDEEAWKWRVEHVAEAIGKIDPDVMALSEMEDADVVQEVANKLAEAGKNYTVAFVQGNDTFTEQDVCFLVREGLDFEGQRIGYTHGGDSDYKDLSKHQLLTVQVNGEPLSLIAIHLITDGNKRLKQARTVRDWVDDLGLDAHVIVLGDTNVQLNYDTVTGDSAPVNTDIGRIRGLHNLAPQDDLHDLHKHLSPADRGTFKNGKHLDRILISKKFDAAGGLDYMSIANRRDLVVRGSTVDGADWSKPDDERDLSDHYPLVATFTITDGSPGGPAPLAGLGRAGMAPLGVAAPQAANDTSLQAILAELHAVRSELTNVKQRLDEIESARNN